MNQGALWRFLLGVMVGGYLACGLSMLFVAGFAAGRGEPPVSVICLAVAVWGFAGALVSSRALWGRHRPPSEPSEGFCEHFRPAGSGSEPGSAGALAAVNRVREK